MSAFSAPFALNVRSNVGDAEIPQRAAENQEAIGPGGEEQI